MMIHRAYRYELDPNNKQQTSLLQHAGAARFAYNWGLEHRISLFKSNEGKDRFTDAMKQHKILNSLKKTEFPWMYDVSKCAPQEALRDLDRAFKHFYRGLRSKRKIGFPKFKKKGRHDSFRLTGTIKFIGRTIQLPRLGRIRLKEKRELYYSGRILSATVSRNADRWFVSVCVEEEITDPESNNLPAVGVDVGILTLATLSDGTTFEKPKAHKRRERKLKRLHKSLSRKRNGSKNREKAKRKLSKEYHRIYCLRHDTLHKLTTFLAKSHGRIVIEDLNVEGMKQNRRLSKAISDVGFGEFRRQLEYKCLWYGSELIIAPRFFPSSKLCSNCGHKMDELKLSTREYVCEQCGIRIDRDLNAALNLVAVSCTETLNACGDDVRLHTNSEEFVEEQTSMNQEPNTIKEVS